MTGDQNTIGIAGAPMASSHLSDRCHTTAPAADGDNAGELEEGIEGPGLLSATSEGCRAACRSTSALRWARPLAIDASSVCLLRPRNSRAGVPPQIPPFFTMTPSSSTWTCCVDGCDCEHPCPVHSRSSPGRTSRSTDVMVPGPARQRKVEPGASGPVEFGRRDFGVPSRPLTDGRHERPDDRWWRLDPDFAHADHGCVRG